MASLTNHNPSINNFFPVFGIGSLIYAGMELGEILEDSNGDTTTVSRWLIPTQPPITAFTNNSRN